MKKLQSIFLKVAHNYFVQLIVITLLILLMAFNLLNSKGEEITFIYNNF